MRAARGDSVGVSLDATIIGKSGVMKRELWHWLGVRKSPAHALDRGASLWMRSAGAPCPICNVADADDSPRMPDGFQTKFDKKG
jgi:hypothetical protein